MKFLQYKDGSCKIIFSWKERFTLFFKGNLYLSDESLRHFGNNLIKIVADWNLNFNKEIQLKTTFDDTKIEGK